MNKQRLQLEFHIAWSWWITHLTNAKATSSQQNIYNKATVKIFLNILTDINNCANKTLKDNNLLSVIAAEILRQETRSASTICIGR